MLIYGLFLYTHFRFVKSLNPQSISRPCDRTPVQMVKLPGSKFRGKREKRPPSPPEPTAPPRGLSLGAGFDILKFILGYTA